MESPVTAQPVARNAYGRVFRERGTRRLILFALLLWAAWYVYSSVHTSLMQRVEWPALSPDPQGLTVVGLRDKPRHGWTPLYVAIHRSKSWLFRRYEDNAGGSGADDAPDEPENADRGNDPGQGKAISKGEIVDIAEIVKNSPTVLTGKHFTGASLEEKQEALFDRTYYGVHLSLNGEGRSRYWQFSRDREDEKLVFVLKGQAITCPEMKHMDTGSLEIQPIWDRADAEALASFINGQG
jgi:hypothetical protein